VTEPSLDGFVDQVRPHEPEAHLTRTVHSLKEAFLVQPDDDLLELLTRDHVVRSGYDVIRI
jgi:hypothetical protein